MFTGFVQATDTLQAVLLYFASFVESNNTFGMLAE